MTKRREPGTLEHALTMIAAVLDWAPMGSVCVPPVVERTVRNWGDPDKAETISLADAVRLDIAYLAAGGIGAPLHDFYSQMVKAARAERFARGDAIVRGAADLMKEAGEACHAAVIAGLPGADREARRRARLELHDVAAVLGDELALLDEDDEPPRVLPNTS